MRNKISAPLWLDLKLKPTIPMNISHSSERSPFLFILVAVAIIIGIASFFGSYHWMLDNLGQFRWQAAVGFLVLALLAWLWEHHHKWPLFTVLCLLLMAGNVFMIARFVPANLYMQQAVAPATGTSLRVMSSNLLYNNSCHACFLAAVQKTNPDFIALQELTPGWEKSLEQLQKEFPHAVLKPHEAAFGMGFLSRWPIVSWKTTNIPSGKLYPALQITVRSPHGLLTFFVVHPPPPLNHRVFTIRNKQLQAIAELAGGTEGPTIVLGDFNIAPWSPHFSVLEKTGGLKNALFLPTWPTNLWPLYIPIDHILTKGPLTVLTNTTVYVQGSDHRSRVSDMVIVP